MPIEDLVRRVRHERLSRVEAGSGAPAAIMHGMGGHKKGRHCMAKALRARNACHAIDMVNFGGPASDVPQAIIATQAAERA